MTMTGDGIDFANFESSASFVTTGMLDRLAEAMIDAFMRRSQPYVVDGSLIGDHCHDVASKLASAPEIGPWLRGVSGGGGSGHYSSFSSLVEVVVALLKNNGTEMRDVAAKCVEVLNDFKGTDDGIRAELDQLASEVEQQTKEDKGVS
ncbi:hypothetical protein JK386_07065 [Nocardioides sp. zg-536]|uniref:Uncharacterized protein n=1 Tax=Nocardioides faecalis TaxID=2803858 RepID=A0A939BXU5_9ACTN|nr:hypothetical protein [Nocardioides faecalis]MBM9459658.1 hypothetical protein [Nocardioides faecalis]QVI58180.1 hypothetical protein KG111_14360 [Nocardioides faecalis]